MFLIVLEDADNTGSKMTSISTPVLLYFGVCMVHLCNKES